ncbi:unnamed protein product [Leptidea sinapis]|uniref:Uncharacterized protein n=1 Tax=Leptidea sinapis TaxID=189913 RepID=A0A5E4PV29_9NEOP|nr:unnamed protein product [Leptidea sinapis]
MKINGKHACFTSPDDLGLHDARQNIVHFRSFTTSPRDHRNVPNNGRPCVSYDIDCANVNLSKREQSAVGLGADIRIKVVCDPVAPTGLGLTSFFKPCQNIFLVLPNDIIVLKEVLPRCRNTRTHRISPILLVEYFAYVTSRLQMLSDKKQNTTAQHMLGIKFVAKLSQGARN